MDRWLALVAAFWVLGCAPTTHAQEPLPEAEMNSPGFPEETAIIENRIRTILRTQMSQCWEMPTDLPEPQRLIVTVAFELNEDGTLRGAPRVVSPRNYRRDAPFRVAVERALRAVRACSPYSFHEDPVLRDHYESWNELEMRFLPR